MQDVLISQEIVELASNPEKLRDIRSERFERIIAELLAGQGYDVQITPPTRDGGYDIMAIRRDAFGIETTTIVECKRYAPEHKVPVDIIRGLYGVKSYLGVSNALLVTTSNFTRDARKFVETKYDIQLFDAADLAKWIRSYVPTPDAAPYSKTRTFKSCFISHSSKDKEFVEQLNSSLRAAGVHVWYASEDLLPGKKLLDQIKKAINSFDRLLLVLSENSMSSDWVTTEIRNARKREQVEGQQVLFPISIVPMKKIKAWECFDADMGQDIAIDIREYYVLDFSDWGDTNNYKRQIDRLLSGLEVDESKTN